MASSEAVELPVVNLSSPDRASTASCIRQNHSVEDDTLVMVFGESKKFFELPLKDKMSLARREYRGYAPLLSENLDPDSGSKGDSKESFYVGPLEDDSASVVLNQWPSQEILPFWRPTIEAYYRKAPYGFSSWSINVFLVCFAFSQLSWETVAPFNCLGSKAE